MVYGIWLSKYLNHLSYSPTDSFDLFLISFNLSIVRCLTSCALKNVRRLVLISLFDLGCFYVRFIKQVNSYFLKVAAKYAICLSSSVILFAVQFSQTNQCIFGSLSPSLMGMWFRPILTKGGNSGGDYRPLLKRLVLLDSSLDCVFLFSSLSMITYDNDS